MPSWLPPEPTVYVIPLYIATLYGEGALLARYRREKRDVIGYERQDTKASILMGLGSLFFTGLINISVFALAKWLYGHRVVTLGTGVLGWAIALLGWDFSFYWFHRAEHRIRILWACHVNHHSSEHYNLSTALRQPWTPWPALLFYPPWALLGVDPALIMISGGINLVYQYWIHTEAITKLPRWFEFIFNTPSHHRVHHGSNEEYLDMNYAGALIIWDRLFGTFTEEKARVRFGLTKNINSFSILTILLHEYRAVFRNVARANGIREKLGVMLHGPEWTAPSLVTRSSPDDR